MTNGNRILRREARRALHGSWKTAIIIILLPGIFSLLFYTAQALLIDQSFTPEALRDTLYGDLLAEDTRSLSGAWAQLLSVLCSGLASQWPILAAFLMTDLVLAPSLALGRNRWFLFRLAGETKGIGMLFCRLNIWYRSLGVILLKFLLFLLWILPAGAGYVLIFLVPRMESAALEIIVNSLITLLIAGGIALAVRALLCYGMTDFILAENPATRACEVLRQSRLRMKKNTGALLLMSLYFYFLGLLAQLAAFLLKLLIGVAVGTVIGLTVSVLINAYFCMSRAAFYRSLSDNQTAAPAQSAEPPEGSARKIAAQ